MPSAGAAAATSALPGRERRAEARSSRIVIETAVKSARTTSDATASGVDGIAASRRTPTPALPPIPWTRPIPKAASGVRTLCR